MSLRRWGADDPSVGAVIWLIRLLAFHILPSGSALISQPQIIIHGDNDLLIGTEIPLCGLDRGVTQQEFDLLEVTAALPAQFGAGAAKVVGAEVLDPDLLR
jgi:hypothetical protein